MTIVVCGAGGQLGTELVAAFRTTLAGAEEVVALDRNGLDITDPAAVRQMMERLQPRVVVNAAAMTDVDACEKHPEVAKQCHEIGPWLLARGAATIGARLVTLSTDYVFAGRDQPYEASCAPDPVNVYGATKAAGEARVRATLADHQIVRTAWLISLRGKSFASAILDAARQGRTLEVVDDQVGSPTVVGDLAEAIVEAALSAPAGTFHRTNQGAASRYELACELVAAAGLDVPVVARATRAGERAARRPSRVILDNSDAYRVGLMYMRPWQDAVRHLVQRSAGGG